MLTAIIETTENCNLGCTFCLRPSFDGKIMSLEILEKVISHFLEQATERVDFIWHGGEPLIAGIDFFSHIPKFQKKYNHNNILIKNNIQTNGTLLNEDFKKFFEEEGFNIGTSIQGTKEIHNLSRIGRDGSPTFNKVIQNISILSKKPSSITVLTKEILGKEKEIYYEIKKYVRGMRISEYFPGGNIPNKGGEDKNMPTPKEYGRSLIKFYQIWKRDTNPIDLRPITDIIKAFVKGKCGSCVYSQDACNFSVIGIKANGDFFTCIRGYPDNRFFIGNINSKPLKEYELMAKEEMEGRIRDLQETKCKDCRFWNICNGGCPQESLKLYGDLKHKSFYCQGRKMLFKEIEKDMMKIK